MVPTLQQVRTSLVIGAAGAALLAAWLASPGSPRCPEPVAAADDGMVLTARLPSAAILPGGQEQNVAVTITAPAGASHARPPLSLAVVIDRSGSMNGAPIAHAKAAAQQLVDKLDPSDAFTIVTYSSGAETVMPIGRATAANKATARAAIERIWDDGGTCISCGLARGTAELAGSPVHDGVRRIVLISDGQANEGVWDRGELAQLVADLAARGVSTSAVGVGLDFDEVTMTRLAQVGHGNYSFVEDTANLGAMFERELGGLTETIATGVRLVVTPAANVRIDEAYGYPITLEGDRVIVPIADLRAGETRKVVLRIQVAAEPGALEVAKLSLGWRRVADGASRTAQAQAIVDVVTDANAVAASTDRDAVRAIEQARSARVLEEATVTYERQGYRAAQQVLQHHMDQVRANNNLDEATRGALAGASGDAIESFATSPAAKAMKTTRAKAYELAH